MVSQHQDKQQAKRSAFCPYSGTLIGKFDERGIYFYCKRCKHEHYVLYEELQRQVRAHATSR